LFTIPPVILSVKLDQVTLFESNGHGDGDRGHHRENQMRRSVAATERDDAHPARRLSFSDLADLPLVVAGG
jgi:hypothetical protein